MTDELGWVPIALSATIEAGTSAGVILDGAEIVVWRDSKGAAHVWEDRCPHRGMRMSFGFVRGDHIACLSHGGQYDAGGQCQYIPAHPDLEVPKTIKIPTYAVEERNGVIWTSLAEAADIAGVPSLDEEAVAVRSLYLDCGLEAIRAGLAGVSLPVSGGANQQAGISDLNSHCWLLTAGSTRLLVAGQKVGAHKSALHLVLLGAPEATTPLRAGIARWAEALRLTLEAHTMAEVA